MTLLDPIWLVLALPLAAAIWRFPSSSQTATLFRAATLLLSLLAVAGLSLRLPSRAGSIVVVADRSRSMPQNSETMQKELIDLLHGGMGQNDRLAVVSFGQTVAIEQGPETGRFPGFTHVVGPDASNLGDAIDAALAVIPKDSPGRLLILSDGRWTGRDPVRTLGVAAGRNVAIDYRHQARPGAGDLAIARIDAPTEVGPGEGFLITAWVQSPADQAIKFEVTRSGKTIAAGERQVAAGLTRLTFRDRATETSSQAYQIRVTGAADDPVPENNTARLLVGVTGPKPILHLTPGLSSSLTALLRAGGLNVRSAQPEKFDITLESLSGYSAVILENVPAEKIGNRGMETLASWVKASGAGLMMTGGKQSYGQGGYYQSPLETVLPVSMELRQEHRKLSVAIVVALDRSGSMAVPVAGGKVKMDLANLGTAQVLDLLGPIDEFGCIAVDTAPHTVAEFGQVADKGRVRDQILRIESMGGGIYIDEALMAAADMIRHAKAGAKHIILFADAADSEQPGNYKELLEKARAAGITVTAIGLGTLMDKDVELLKDIARRGGGRFYITDNPEELPRLFAQDTFVVARNTFVDDPVRVQPTGGLHALTGRSFSLDRAIGGYNLCYLRPDASLGAFTLDEYKAPAVASWQSGTGRVLCYTGEADGKHAGAFARSPEAGEFYASLARWTAGERGSLAEGMALTQDLRNGVNRIQVHLDPNRKSDPFAGMPQVTTVRALPGERPRTDSVALAWTGPDTLTAELPLDGDETSLSTVLIPGQKPQPLAPVCLPYSPEFAPDAGDADRGRALLEQLARATGGVDRIDLSSAWKDLPRRPRIFLLTHWLLLGAVLCLLLEVLERRTGLASRFASVSLARLRRGIPFRRGIRTPTMQSAGDKRDSLPQSAAPVASSPAAARESPAKPAPPREAVEAKEGVLDALRKARERSRGRSDA